MMGTWVADQMMEEAESLHGSSESFEKRYLWKIMRKTQSTFEADDSWSNVDGSGQGSSFYHSPFDIAQEMMEPMEQEHSWDEPPMIKRDHEAVDASNGSSQASLYAQQWRYPNV
ncbi:hypothetical protein NC653_019806 [Populus alba x Populus x berolinensis]|uniref:Uncharacterized protein n=1 Tax=Populus alba x Populus x berolinensis TaxID=444605 RepID=A0AAD6QD31_9ROSI|nr:hypothetical protein NC653_019806 [Populus alba x Populus x berolinensis]